MIKYEIFWHFYVSNQKKVSRMSTFCSNHWKFEGPFSIGGPWFQTWCGTTSIKRKSLKWTFLVFFLVCCNYWVYYWTFLLPARFPVISWTKCFSGLSWCVRSKSTCWLTHLEQTRIRVWQKKKPEFASHINLTRNLI